MVNLQNKQKQLLIVKQEGNNMFEDKRKFSGFKKEEQKMPKDTGFRKSKPGFRIDKKGNEKVNFGLDKKSKKVHLGAGFGKTKL